MPIRNAIAVAAEAALTSETDDGGGAVDEMEAAGTRPHCCCSGHLATEDRLTRELMDAGKSQVLRKMGCASGGLQKTVGDGGGDAASAPAPVAVAADGGDGGDHCDGHATLPDHLARSASSFLFAILPSKTMKVMVRKASSSSELFHAVMPDYPSRSPPFRSVVT